LLIFLRELSFIDKVLISQSASINFQNYLHPWTTIMNHISQYTLIEKHESSIPRLYIKTHKRSRKSEVKELNGLAIQIQVGKSRTLQEAITFPMIELLILSET
jgi:hypothetical protein